MISARGELENFGVGYGNSWKYKSLSERISIYTVFLQEQAVFIVVELSLDSLVVKQLLKIKLYYSSKVHKTQTIHFRQKTFQNSPIFITKFLITSVEKNSKKTRSLILTCFWILMTPALVNASWISADFSASNDSEDVDGSEVISQLLNMTEWNLIYQKLGSGNKPRWSKMVGGRNTKRWL